MEKNKNVKQPWVAKKYEAQESRDLSLFKQFVKVFPLNTFLTAATNYNCQCDTVSSNETGGTCAWELKLRSKHTLACEDLMIEPGKFDYLMRLWKKKGIWSFYLNFFEGTNIAYLFFIPGLEGNVDKLTVKKNMRIKYDGGTGTKVEDRVFLPWKYGYKLNIKTGEILEYAQDNKTVPAPKSLGLDFSKIIDCKELI